MENKEIAKQVEQTQSYINKMFFLSMCSNSSELNRVLDNLEEFKKVFPEITFEDWANHSDKNELPNVLSKYGYDGWLIEVIVPQRERFKTKNQYRKVVQKKFIYCDAFNDIIPAMIEFSKDALEEDIIKFNKNKNENK